MIITTVYNRFVDVFKRGFVPDNVDLSKIGFLDEIHVIYFKFCTVKSIYCRNFVYDIMRGLDGDIKLFCVCHSFLKVLLKFIRI